MNNHLSDNHKGQKVINKKNIKKTICRDNTPVLKVNIEYPEISDGTLKVNKIFTNFYYNLAENYAKYCEDKLSKQIFLKNIRNDDFRPFGEIMKYHITLNNSKYISVLLEITHFDGYFSKTSRYSHVWDTEKGILLPCDYFLRKMKINVKTLRREVAKIIYERIKDGGEEFGYTEKRVRRYAMKTDPNNFFLTENGLAIWFDRDTLAPETEGFPTFIIKSCTF